MHSRIKRVMSALLCAVLVSASTEVAFAGSAETLRKDDEKVSAREISAEASGMGSIAASVKDAVSQAKLDSSAKKFTSEGSIPLTKWVTGNEKAQVSIVSYDLNDIALRGNYRGVATQVALTKGTVTMGVAAAGNDPASTGNVYFGVFKDAALTQPVNNYYNVQTDNTGNTIETRSFQIPSKGNYYLGVYSLISEYTSIQRYGVAVSAIFASGDDRTLTNGKQIAVGQKDAQTNYFKFKAAKTGYITVQSSKPYDSAYLYSSKKKSLSKATSFGYEPTYGVKKGTTYYIRVDSRSNTDGGYLLKVTNTAVSEKSGKSKAKAVTIAKGKTKKGTITAGSGQADWYKIKLTSKKKVTFTFKGRTNDGLKFAIYKGGKQVIGSPVSYAYTLKSRKVPSKGKWTKGTYYIKVYRGNAKSSGWYSISWK